MQIPLLDLKLQYQQIREEVTETLQEVLNSQQFILGPKVAALEQQLAEYLGAEFAIGVSSGTDALLVSLMALGIGPGDEVITTPYSFFATAGVIARLSARPVFVDIEPQSCNISPERLKECLQAGGKKKYKALIPVHLFGQCAAMDPLMELAAEYELPVIEDAAQSLGASYKNRPAGTIGNAGCFSFFPSKNLGGFGDGGMVVTNDADFAAKVRSLRVHGEDTRYHHRFVGGNFRLDALQAAILLVKFKYLDNWNRKRQKNAQTYQRLFKDHKLTELVKLPETSSGNFHIFNQYVIRVPDRDKLAQFLRDQGIATAVYYPVPLHLQECFLFLGYKCADFPEAEHAAAETLALPVYPELTPEEQKYVVLKIKEFFRDFKR